MNAIISTPVQERESAKDLLAAAFERHAATLVDWFADRAGEQQAEDLAADVWVELASLGGDVDRRVLELDWLLLVAGNIFRRYSGGDGLEVLTAPADLDQVGVEEGGFELVDADDELTRIRAVRRASAESEFEPTALGFRRSHGDPVTWSSSDFEAYGNLAETGAVSAVTAPVVRLPRSGDESVEGVRAA